MTSGDMTRAPEMPPISHRQLELKKIHPVLQINPKKLIFNKECFDSMSLFIRANINRPTDHKFEGNPLHFFQFMQDFVKLL